MNWQVVRVLDDKSELPYGPPYYMRHQAKAARDQLNHETREYGHEATYEVRYVSPSAKVKGDSTPA